MEAIFNFIPADEFSSTKMAEPLTLQPDFQEFLRKSLGKQITVSLKHKAQKSEKERMYDYYHKCILGVAMQMYTDDGYVGVDKVVADYLLKSECGKSIVYNKNTDTETVYLLDKASMNKERLRKFIMDCVNYLEIERGYRVPDSAAYMMELKTGISGFSSVQSKRYEK